MREVSTGGEEIRSCMVSGIVSDLSGNILVAAVF
jgi:hypothetical protein